MSLAFAPGPPVLESSCFYPHFLYKNLHLTPESRTPGFTLGSAFHKLTWCFCLTGKLEDRTFDSLIGEVFNTLCTNTKSSSILDRLKRCQHVTISKDSSFIAWEGDREPYLLGWHTKLQRSTQFSCTVEYFAAGPGDRTPVVRLGSKLLNSLNHLSHLRKKLSYTKFIKCSSIILKINIKLEGQGKMLNPTV